MRETGSRIRDLRDEMGLTQIELAARIGIAHNTIAQYENGKCKMSIDVLIKIVKVMETSADYLLGLRDR